MANNEIEITVEDVNIKFGAYVVRKYFFGEADCGPMAETTIKNYGYDPNTYKLFNINADFALLLINNVPSSKNLSSGINVHGIFLIEDTQDEIIIQLEHHTGQDYGMGYVEYIPKHFFRGSCFSKSK